MQDREADEEWLQQSESDHRTISIANVRQHWPRLEDEFRAKSSKPTPRSDPFLSHHRMAACCAEPLILAGVLTGALGGLQAGVHQGPVSAPPLTGAGSTESLTGHRRHWIDVCRVCLGNAATCSGGLGAFPSRATWWHVTPVATAQSQLTLPHLRRSKGKGLKPAELDGMAGTMAAFLRKKKVAQGPGQHPASAPSALAAAAAGSAAVQGTQPPAGLPCTPALPGSSQAPVAAPLGAAASQPGPAQGRGRSKGSAAGPASHAGRGRGKGGKPASAPSRITELLARAARPAAQQSSQAAAEASQPRPEGQGAAKLPAEEAAVQSALERSNGGQLAAQVPAGPAGRESSEDSAMLGDTSWLCRPASELPVLQCCCCVCG